MTLSNLFIFTGLWLFLPIEVFMYYVAYELISPRYLFYEEIRLIILVAPVLIIISSTLTNISRYRYGHRDFSLKDALGKGQKEIHEGKAAHDAMYPKVKRKYLSRYPKDFVLGTTNNGRYIHYPLSEDGTMVYVIGAPGSHKTVMLISWLYAVYYQKRIYRDKSKKAGRMWNFVVVDIKGEIYRKLIKIKGQYVATGKERLRVFEPSNRLSYGWDVFYMLKGEHISDTTRLKALQDIADGLVEETKNNTYFSDNAKKILMGVLYFYSKKGEDFIPIIKKINSEPMDKLLEEIVKEAKIKGDSVTLSFLAGFVGKKDNESIQDVESTLKTKLQTFVYPDIVYALQNNPYKTSPRDLNTGKVSIDIAIEESMLAIYRPLFRLLCIQILKHCAAEFREEDNRMTSLIYDEAAAIKKIPDISNTMATCRSKHVNVCLIFQARTQFDSIYGRDEADTILNLCKLKIFLSCEGDKSTIDYVQNMTGKYIDKKQSYQKKGALIKNASLMDEEKPIVDGRALMSLTERKEAVVFINGNYYRIKKIMYFKDPYLAPIASEVINFNKNHTINKNKSKAKETTQQRARNKNRKCRGRYNW